MDRDELASVVECAELAPSVHNTQPWSFAATADAIDVRADRTRALPVLDPQGRELTISCGAAIEFARIAVTAQGWDCTVELLPDAHDGDLLARLRIGERRAVDPGDRLLLEAIPRRYTDRGEYATRAIERDLMAELHQGVGRRDAWLRILDHDGDRLAVIQALTSAEAAEAADPAYRLELASWLRNGHAEDGVPIAALRDSEKTLSVTDVPTRDFTGTNTHRHPGGDGPAPPVERDTLLMVGTSEDNPRSWIAAGQAIGWLLLRLTVAGLSSQPLGQALDIESERDRLSRELGLLGHVQFLLRTGEGSGMPATSRRHLTTQI